MISLFDKKSIHGSSTKARLLSKAVTRSILSGRPPNFHSTRLGIVSFREGVKFTTCHLQLANEVAWRSVATDNKSGSLREDGTGGTRSLGTRNFFSTLPNHLGEYQRMCSNLQSVLLPE